ncbi:MAG: hypothetical protein HY902_21230 [Deltaproteobacteria bacterium]|nr:hypothetical protein [Deltaproteobacteria bacterium]
MQHLFQISLDAFSPMEILVFSMTYPLWIWAYVLMIRRAWKDKVYAAPLVASAVMFSYEFCFVFIWPLGQGLPEFSYAKWFEYAWLIMDVVLLVQCAAYAKKTVPNTPLAQYPVTITVGTTALALLGMWSFVDWTGMSNGAVAAILACCLIGGQFPLMILDRSVRLGRAATAIPGQGISFWSIVLRTLGDLSSATATFTFFMLVGGKARPGVADATATIEQQGIMLKSVVGDPTAVYLSTGKFDFALAPISPLTSFTIFMMLLLFCTNILSIAMLVRARRRAGLGLPLRESATA